MHPIKSIIYIFIIVLLTACNSISQLEQAASSVFDNSIAMVGVTERKAFELVLVALEQRPNPDLDCLQFLPESKNDSDIAMAWEFAAIEVHDEICGGDPYVGHVRNRYKVNADGSIMIYSVRDAEYKPF